MYNNVKNHCVLEQGAMTKSDNETEIYESHTLTHTHHKTKWVNRIIKTV